MSIRHTNVQRRGKGISKAHSPRHDASQRLSEALCVDSTHNAFRSGPFAEVLLSRADPRCLNRKCNPPSHSILKFDAFPPQQHCPCVDSTHNLSYKKKKPAEAGFHPHQQSQGSISQVLR